jgi:hypothetical protein
MDKAESNRRNATHSTGPKTPTGKAAVARNAVKHGAYSEALTMLLEEPEDFTKLRDGMVQTFQPSGPMEVGLVDRMASLWWRMERAKVAANQDLWETAMAKLISDPPRRADDNAVNVQQQKNIYRVNGAWNHDKQDRLLRHEMTLERSFFHLLHELERIQSRRQGQNVLPPAVVDVNLDLNQD